MANKNGNRLWYFTNRDSLARFARTLVELDRNPNINDSDRRSVRLAIRALARDGRGALHQPHLYKIKNIHRALTGSALSVSVGDVEFGTGEERKAVVRQQFQMHGADWSKMLPPDEPSPSRRAGARPAATVSEGDVSARLAALEEQNATLLRLVAEMNDKLDTLMRSEPSTKPAKAKAAKPTIMPQSYFDNWFAQFKVGAFIKTTDLHDRLKAVGLKPKEVKEVVRAMIDSGTIRAEDDNGEPIRKRNTALQTYKHTKHCYQVLTVDDEHGVAIPGG